MEKNNELAKELEEALENIKPLAEKAKKYHEEVMNTDIMKLSLKELRKLKNFRPKENFNGIVIVPMKENHDSDFSCMKFVLLKDYDIVGVVGGWSDVIHINGIGGYGNKLDLDNPRKGYGWSIDCLPVSKCTRLFIHEDKELYADNFIGSDFIFYVKEN